MDNIDMVYDGFEPLQSIDLWPNQNMRGRLLLHMEMAQALMQPESLYQDWLRRLRFVVEVPHWNTGYDYELIQSNSLEDLLEPYIAISYRWPEKKSVVPPVKHKILVQTPGRPGERFWRPVNAPIDVLQRSFSFARAHGIRKIWIDQECIEQEDEDDVAKAIQSMHVVYRRASIVLAVLNRHVKSDDDLYDLADVKGLRGGGLTSIRPRMMMDPWWTRAWTAQELGVSMYHQLRTMVGWHESFDVEGTGWTELTELYNQICYPEDRQNVFREWVSPNDRKFTLMGSRISHLDELAENSALPVEFHQKEGARSQKDSEIYTTDGIMKKVMTEGIRLFHRKECLKISDKLAMFGNLGYYHHRIDKNRAVKLRLGFTACALALALYNGDSSPLFCGVPEQPQHPYVDADCLPTWLPHHPTSLEGIGQTSRMSLSPNPLPEKLCKALVLDGKLAIKGFMWDISQYRGFEQVADQMRTQQDPTLRL
ncbi:hypothetical protein G7054_g10470 [Neopestalotiopsis clavispora]|nr:hypothetical protein G7054_g10470 [Neopestalotiopsis clavispora]